MFKLAGAGVGSEGCGLGVGKRLVQVLGYFEFTLGRGQFATSVLERVVVTEGITGGTVGLVRAGSAAVRRAQTGFLRYYAAAMVVCLSGVALYFLLASS